MSDYRYWMDQLSSWDDMKERGDDPYGSGTSIAENREDHTLGTVVYQKTVAVSRKSTATLILYFLQTIHAPTHGSAPVTNADLAKWLVVDAAPWARWFRGTVSSLDFELLKEVEARVDLIYSEEMKRARREWRTAINTRGFKATIGAYSRKIRTAEADIKAAQADFRRATGYRYASDMRMPDFESLSPRDMGLREQVEWISSQRKAFRSAMSTARARIGIARTALAALRGGEKAMSVEAVGRYAGKWRAESLETIDAKMEDALMKGDANAVMRLSEQKKMVIDPYSFGFSARKALEKAGKDVRDLVADALHGAKSPDIKEKTKKNRMYRGNSASPPLDETGEFAESIMWKVI